MSKRRKRRIDKLPQRSQNREQVKDPERRSVIKALIYGTAALSVLALSDNPRHIKVQSKTKVKESTEYVHTPPDLIFEKEENIKKPTLAKELNEEQIKVIAQELKKYCEFHLKNVEKLVNEGRITDDILGRVVMAIIKGADQIFIRNIPGFEGFKGMIRSWKDAVRYINEFLEHEEKFLFIFNIHGEKIVNMYDVSEKYNVKSPDIGEIGRQFLLERPRLTHYKANMQCSVSSSDLKLAVCFDEKIKRYIDVNQNDFSAFDRAKGEDYMNKEVYESSRYHEAVHVYHYKKYPAFKKLRHEKGPRRKAAAQIDELCAIAAELSKTNDLMGALSWSGSHVPEYRLAHKIFTDLMSQKTNGNKRAVFDYIKGLNDTSEINEVGRKMYDIGIKRLEAFIVE